jgi:hypothetical protein
MSYVITAEKELNQIVAPNLPLATIEYSRQYQDQLNNVLRLYFNRIDSLVGQLTASGQLNPTNVILPYGAFSCLAQTTLTAGITSAVTTIPVASTDSFPVASVGTPKAFYIGNETITYTGKTPTSFTGCVRGALSTTAAAHLINADVEGTQIAYTTNTAYALFFNTTDFANNTALVNTTAMTVDIAGIYNMQFSVQIQNADNAPQDVFIWLRQNGTDIIASTGKVGMPARKGVGNPSHDIKGWNYFLSMQAGDNVEVWWSTTSTNVTIPNYVATPLPTKPSTASVVATMTFVSALP